MAVIIHYMDHEDPANPSPSSRVFDDREEGMVFSNLVGTNLIRIETTGDDADPESDQPVSFTTTG